MLLTPLTGLNCAYQLLYYLCFRTHRRRRFFESNEPLLQRVVAEICDRHDYHLLETQPFSDHLRCLISLRPSQGVAKTVQTIKTNSSREIARSLGLVPPVWARGYLTRSLGHVRIASVREYLANQPTHHGYDSRILPPVYRYRDKETIPLRTAHASFELNHHLVLGTFQRQGVFSSSVGRALSEYWLRVAAKHGFVIDQLSIVPDHSHLLVRLLPTMTVEECALWLLNNGQYFIGKHYPHLLIEKGLNQLWQGSAYAGTCGEYTAGLIQKWLSSAG